MSDDILKRQRRVSLTMAEITFLWDLLSVYTTPEAEKLWTKFNDICTQENDADLQRIKTAYRNAVKAKDGKIEIDPDAEVSIGDDPGAYVQVWMWVDAASAGICSKCGQPDANNGEGYDGLCGNCADKASFLSKED